ncbi:MAG: hypothetical protein WAV73_02215 [Candidatus Moraniibacteriota bacterium]
MSKEVESEVFKENKKRGVSYSWCATPGRLRVVPETADYELSNYFQDVDNLEAAKEAIAKFDLETSLLAAAYVFDDKGRVVYSAKRIHAGGATTQEFHY